MAKKAIVLTIIALVASLFIGCDKAPSGVIPESDMVHVLADFAKADALIEQFPGKFPDDSSKLALKQSILERYDADLAMYDSSLVWYAHNLKLYSELHDKAVLILEKEGNIKHDDNKPGNMWVNNTPLNGSHASAIRRVFPNTGDSANIWTEPQQWILTSALRRGYITYDYKPDQQHRQGDSYSLNLKAINASGNNINILLAIDYNDGTTSYTNRTLNINGWSNYDIQSDTARTVKRIYGYIQYSIKPQRVTFIDSIYLLRTHFDPTNYHRISIQRIAGPKAMLGKSNELQSSEENNPSDIASPRPSFPGRPSLNNARPSRPSLDSVRGPVVLRNGDTIYRPKPGLNKTSVPNRVRSTGPYGDHTPHPPIK